MCIVQFKNNIEILIFGAQLGYCGIAMWLNGSCFLLQKNYWGVLLEDCVLIDSVLIRVLHNYSSTLLPPLTPSLPSPYPYTKPL